jgi:hypothetical protein
VAGVVNPAVHNIAVTQGSHVFGEWGGFWHE